jgi:hypothetical protein
MKVQVERAFAALGDLVRVVIDVYGKEKVYGSIP